MSAPEVRFVDHVVVQQRCGVNELYDGGEFMVSRPFVPERSGAEQNKCRAEALASGVDDVFSDLPDECHIGVQAFADHRVDGLHVRSDQVVESLEFQRILPRKKPWNLRGRLLLPSRREGKRTEPFDPAGEMRIMRGSSLHFF